MIFNILRSDPVVFTWPLKAWPGKFVFRADGHVTCWPLVKPQECLHAASFGERAHP